MPDIVLTTLNARYAHAAFGLRYLLANLGELQPQAQILEFDIHQRPLDVAEAILRQQPRIVGVGVYIWNVVPSTQLVAALKQIRPDLIVVLGGPEISFETEQQEIARLADYVITGEGDLAFAELCREVLIDRTSRPSVGHASRVSVPTDARAMRSPGHAGRVPDRNQADTRDTYPTPPRPTETTPPRSRKIRAAPLPDLAQLALPYSWYTDEDIAHRVIYVEASRGCPFACEFCLSSLDIPVRNVPLEPLLAALQQLLDRGVRQFKFVDRTFNLNLATSRAILEFFLDRYRPGLFVHFEMIPDRLPEPLREIIRRFPPGALQFEVGIQTFNESVAALISRRQNNARAEDNLRWLRTETGVHIHADLIVGLPGESLESFAAGFDRLVALQPHEIQVGILKRLRGTPISRHAATWSMVYDPHPPYEVLQTSLFDFPTLQRLRRFSRYWDLIANSGRFPETVKLICTGPSAFEEFLAFSDWLFGRVGRAHAIALPRLQRLATEYLATQKQIAANIVQAALDHDVAPGNARVEPSLPRRQQRHLAAAGGGGEL